MRIIPVKSIIYKCYTKSQIYHYVFETHYNTVTTSTVQLKHFETGSKVASYINRWQRSSAVDVTADRTAYGIAGIAVVSMSIAHET